jgi:hypothetical protein
MITSIETLRSSAKLVDADLHKPADAWMPAALNSAQTQRLKVSFEARLPVDDTNKNGTSTRTSFALSRKIQTASTGQIRGDDAKRFTF